MLFVHKYTETLIHKCQQPCINLITSAEQAHKTYVNTGYWHSVLNTYWTCITVSPCRQERRNKKCLFWCRTFL